MRSTIPTYSDPHKTTSLEHHFSQLTFQSYVAPYLGGTETSTGRPSAFESSATATLKSKTAR